MDSTFHYINAAPQWQIINKGNWYELEENCRKLALRENLDLDTYTGTSGVSELPHIETDILVRLYITGGQNKIPVPEYFWKILHDTTRNLGVAQHSIWTTPLRLLPM